MRPTGHPAWQSPTWPRHRSPSHVYVMFTTAVWQWLLSNVTSLGIVQVVVHWVTKSRSNLKPDSDSGPTWIIESWLWVIISNSTWLTLEEPRPALMITQNGSEWHCPSPRYYRVGGVTPASPGPWQGGQPQARIMRPGDGAFSVPRPGYSLPGQSILT